MRVCQPEPDKVDTRVARLAARQYGVVDTADLQACGLSRNAISTRVNAGRLHPLYRGVYAVGHPVISLRGRCLAAVKACGPGSVISHFAAAFLWGLLEPFERYPDVTAPTKRVHPAINTHVSQVIDATLLHGIPVTTPLQTLIHLSAVLPYKTLRKAVNEALNRRLVTVGQLVTSRHRGAKQLRRTLATAAPTRSENENLILHLIHEAGLPKPLVNPRIPRTTKIPDFLWPDHHLVLEADSRRFHDNPIARADDAAKQAELEALGYSVIRTTWAEATTRSDRLLARVQRELTRAEPPGALLLRSA
jgi:very-short-patch-repair endonuclease